MVDENQVTIVSNSYGEPESAEALEDIVANEQAFQQGALQGITFFFSSGDNGDEQATTGTLQADYPASDPYVTSVGGTSTGIAADGSLAFQTGWGTQKYALSADGAPWTPQGFLYGSGGGYSSLFNRPDYQSKVIPPAPAGPRVPGRRDGRRPDDRDARRRDPAVPRRPRLRRVPDRRHQPRLAADGGRAGAHQQRAGGRHGLHQPGALQGGQEQPGQFLDVAGPARTRATCARTTSTALDPPAGSSTASARSTRTRASRWPGWDDVTGVGSPSPQVHQRVRRVVRRACQAWPVIARVEPLTTTRRLSGPFDYRVEGPSRSARSCACRSGTRSSTGSSWASRRRPRSPDEKLVDVTSVRGDSIPRDLVDLALWMAEEYCSTPARALALVSPPPGKAKTAFWAEATGARARVNENQARAAGAAARRPRAAIWPRCAGSRSAGWWRSPSGSRGGRRARTRRRTGSWS